MKQYWARHQGRTRWGVRTRLETSDEIYKTDGGVFFVWADKVELEGGSLVFRSADGELRAALAAGSWEAVFEAAEDDQPQAVETKR